MVVSPDHANVDFPYTSLDASPRQFRQFRLFALQGRDEKGIPYGHMTTTSADDSVDFIALSYEWGDGHPTHRIFVNDRPLSVRNNLYAFLVTTRDQGGLERPIFIDALCVNQADRAERNTEVRLMPAIYSQAIELRAWLGPLPAWWRPDPRVSHFFDARRMGSWVHFNLYMLYYCAFFPPSNPYASTSRYSTNGSPPAGWTTFR